MADDQQLSPQEYKELQDIASQLPTGHPAQKKVAALLASQKTPFELERPGSAREGGGFGANFAGAFLPQGVSPYPGMDTEAKAEIASSSRAADALRKKEGAGLAYRVGAALPFTNAAAMEDAARRGDTSGVAGAAAAPMVMAATPLAPEAASRVRARVGNAMFEPTSSTFTESKSPTGSMIEYGLKPNVSKALRVAGGAGGALAGALPGIAEGKPYLAYGGGSVGAGVGAALGPSMAEAMFKPQPKPVFPGAQLPSVEDFYVNRGAEINAANTIADKVARQQAKAAAAEAKANAKIPNWETPAHDVFELGSPEYPGPFSKIPSRVAPQFRGDPFAPPTGETTSGIWEPETERLIRGAPSESPALRSIRRQSMEDPIAERDDLISRMRKIARPGEVPDASDLKRAGDFTQVSTEKLRTLAKFGDKLAQNELNRRLKQ